MKPGPIKLNDIERRVLRALAHYYDGWGFGYIAFKTIAKRARIDRKKVRRAARSLARKGLAEYGRGLFTEDGEVAGSGYACTKAGKLLLEGSVSK